MSDTHGGSSQPASGDQPPTYAHPPAAYPPAGGQPPYGQGPPPYYGQFPPNYYPQPIAKPTNGLAIASLVLGIVWIYWIGSVLALIFGYVARNQIRRNNQSGAGMAIAGIVLGWVGVGSSSSSSSRPS